VLKAERSVLPVLTQTDDGTGGAVAKVTAPAQEVVDARGLRIERPRIEPVQEEGPA